MTIPIVQMSILRPEWLLYQPKVIQPESARIRVSLSPTVFLAVPFPARTTTDYSSFSMPSNIRSSLLT